MNNYSDIINLPHHKSKKHPPMSMEARAAQFAPFAALTGYEDNIKETARLTDNKIIIDEEEKEILNAKLITIEENINNNPKIEITYFIKDSKKEGGKYITSNIHIKKIDKLNSYIYTKENVIININDIINITSDDIIFPYDML